MDISPQLLQYRYHFVIAIFVSLIFSLMLYAAPRILTILGYFWPLFASTTIFLVAVIAFGGVSQLSTESHGEAQGQGIIDYVAGQPDYTN
ncbi:hypothetical protein ACFX13_037949 [Malus domestica]